MKVKTGLEFLEPKSMPQPDFHRESIRVGESVEHFLELTRYPTVDDKGRKVIYYAFQMYVRSLMISSN